MTADRRIGGVAGQPAEGRRIRQLDIHTRKLHRPTDRVGSPPEIPPPRHPVTKRLDFGDTEIGREEPRLEAPKRRPVGEKGAASLLGG